MAVAQGDIVAFLDDRAVAGPGWLAALAGHYQDPRVLGVGGMVRPEWPDGRPSWFAAGAGLGGGLLLPGDAGRQRPGAQLHGRQHVLPPHGPRGWRGVLQRARRGRRRPARLGGHRAVPAHQPAPPRGHLGLRAGCRGQPPGPRHAGHPRVPEVRVLRAGPVQGPGGTAGRAVPGFRPRPLLRRAGAARPDLAVPDPPGRRQAERGHGRLDHGHRRGHHHRRLPGGHDHRAPRRRLPPAARRPAEHRARRTPRTTRHRPRRTPGQHRHHSLCRLAYRTPDTTGRRPRRHHPVHSGRRVRRTPGTTSRRARRTPGYRTPHPRHYRPPHPRHYRTPRPTTPSSS